ncbi:MAG: HAD-IA family hydrolase, partial [Aeromonas sp.]
DTFLLVASKLGVEPSGCLVFEDTGIGVQAGEAAGMQTCLVKTGKPVGITA